MRTIHQNQKWNKEKKSNKRKAKRLYKGGEWFTCNLLTTWSLAIPNHPPNHDTPKGALAPSLESNMRWYRITSGSQTWLLLATGKINLVLFGIRKKGLEKALSFESQVWLGFSANNLKASRIQQLGLRHSVMCICQNCYNYFLWLFLFIAVAYLANTSSILTP